MRIPRRLHDQLIAHAREEAPNECCGMIATLDGEAVVVHRAVNAAASPLKYVIEPRDQLRIHNAIEDAGHELGAIYHSHTRTDPVPSQTDINLALWPQAIYVIVGVADPERPDLRAFSIVDGEVSQRELVVTEG